MSERIIKIITADKFVKFDAWVSAEIGNINPVFQAAIRHPELGILASHCKLYPRGNGERGIINEIIGFLFAHALGIPQPRAAFLAHIPRKHIPLAKLGKDHWVNQHQEPQILAFCTASLFGKTAAMSYKPLDETQTKYMLEDISHWGHCANTIALDENIAHVDRHANNLIRLGKRSYAVIDNGFLASTTSFNWIPDDLVIEREFPNRMATYMTLVNEKQRETIKGSAISAGEKHAETCTHITEEMKYWIGCLLPQSEGIAFMQFLLQRAEKTPWLLKHRYHVMI